ncbi:sulfide:quinone oxidoreductase, mitochondrial [Anthonomus grandis grandis]|uniref:sulfide:quinone oxidoreductase, mitochondrial n=1 Tax=Anthonomus grandis grandis TaxID=2921223 RepID=UPI0021661089|nr:sulfide:quinone oxidoreductase, mitochondrial [Anthonomus grandis grandis]
MLSARYYIKMSQLRHLPALGRHFSLTKTSFENHSCKVLVVGGGTGGCAVTAKLSRKLKKTDLIVLEPSEEHYYQPLFTLIGAGIENIETARKSERACLTKNCTWLKDQAAEFDLNRNIVKTVQGHQIEYDYLIVSTGIIPRYEKIPGLLDALKDRSSGVCSIYLPKYVENVYPTMQRLNSGNAIFTFPNSPVKCPGAPQKICYLTEDYLRRENKRSKVNVIYNTSLPVIFGVKKYADALWKVCKSRNIAVNTRTNLVSIDPVKKEAVFENLDKPEVKTILPYSMLHVTPPMSTDESISNNKELTNSAGFVEVNKTSLQHVRFPNVFAIGDCSSSPNSKTAAAAAAQVEVVFENLQAVINGQKPLATYDGYASCPLVTGYDKCILAEFDYDLNPLETFPFSQDKERLSMYLLKKNIIPAIYWSLMMNGLWNGPAMFRKIMHLGRDK